MTTRVVKEGNVTTTVVDMTNGVGGRSAEVRKMQKKVQSIHVYHYYMSQFMCKGPVEKYYHILEGHRNVKEEGKVTE